MRVAMLLLMMMGCASRTTVIVRMARPGEVLGEAPEPHVVLAPGKHINRFGCRAWGLPAKELYGPVIAFARENLITELDGCARAGDAHARLILPGVRPPPIRQGIELLVDPRGHVGSLRMSIRSGSWHAGTFYCLHVIEEYGMRTVVLKYGGGWIK